MGLLILNLCQYTHIQPLNKKKKSAVIDRLNCGEILFKFEMKTCFRPKGNTVS